MIHFAEQVAAFLFLVLLGLGVLLLILAGIDDANRKEKERQERLALEWARALPEPIASEWLPVVKARGLVAAWRQAMLEQRLQGTLVGAVRRAMKQERRR